MKANRTGALLLTALVLAAVGPLSQAQDSGAQHDARQAQKDAADAHSEAAREGRENDRLNNDPSLNNDGSRRQDAGRGADDRGAVDRVTDLHRTHPNAAARCHDGFFTTTRDRGRACTRHGGIDVWLSG